MDCMDGFPHSSRGNKRMLNIVDRLAKSAHFILVKATRDEKYMVNKLAQLVVRHHSIPQHIMLDRDHLFALVYWQSLHSTLGTKHSMRTTYHP